MSKLFVNTIAPNSGDTVTVSGSLTTTGKLIIGDESTDTVVLTAEVSSSILPDASATYDLGTMAKAWRNLHAHGLGHIHTASINLVSSSLLPDADNTYDLGSSGKQWKDLYINGTANIDAFGADAAALISGSFLGYLSGSGIVSHSLQITNGSGIVSNSLQFTNTDDVEFRNITASIISASGTVSANQVLTPEITASKIIIGNNVGGAGMFLSPRAFAVAATGSTVIVEFSGSMTASGDISSSGTITANAINIGKSTAASQDLNLLAGVGYSVNGSKVEVRAITAGAISDGAFASFKLLNTSIQTDSIVYGSFTGGTAGIITGSILTSATTAASTASVQIHNETGATIAADTPFTASFIVL